jgi:hypothetical protein
MIEQTARSEPKSRMGNEVERANREGLSMDDERTNERDRAARVE